MDRRKFLKSLVVASAAAALVPNISIHDVETEGVSLRQYTLSPYLLMRSWYATNSQRQPGFMNLSYWHNDRCITVMNPMIRQHDAWAYYPDYYGLYLPRDFNVSWSKEVDWWMVLQDEKSAFYRDSKRPQARIELLLPNRKADG